MISDDWIQYQQQERPRYPWSTGCFSAVARTAVVKKKGYDRSAAFLRHILMMAGLVCISRDVLKELTAVWLCIREICSRDLEQNIVSLFSYDLLRKRNKRIRPLNHVYLCQRQREFTKKWDEQWGDHGEPRFQGFLSKILFYFFIYLF